MKRSVKKYYENLESKYGYKLVLKDSQHFGYYPKINDKISEFKAQNNLHNLLMEKLDLKPKHYILDAGSGRGVVSSYIAKKINVKILGVDIVPYIVEVAKKRAHYLGLNKKLTYLNETYDSTKLKDATFDRVYSVETLSHSSNLKESVKNLYRVLKPNGIAVFIEYEIAPFNQFTKKELEIYRFVRDGSAMHSLDDFIEGNFVKVLKQQGFEILEDLDITKNRSKSMRRLFNLAYFPYQLIKIFGLRRFFVNTTAGVECYKLNEKNLFRYHVYKVKK